MRLLFSIIAIFVFCECAVAQNKVYICKKNGLVDAYDVSAVDSITFSKPDASSGLLLKPEALEELLCDNLKTYYSDLYKNDARKLKRNLRILGIGNSWTLNCTQHLGYILDNLGINVEIYRSFAGSAPLEMYWNDVSSDDAKFEFSYRKPFGEYESLGLKSIKEILETEQFDIVVFQQVSQDAGKYSTYQPYLNNLIDLTKSIKEIVPDIYFHSTWAYPDGCTHWGFPNYNNDNATMYKAILSATNQMIEETGISLIIPNAPNIQQACEADETGLFWQQDEGQGYYGRHLQNGCYSAACVWAETFIQKFFDSKILKKSVEDCTYYGPYDMGTAKKMQKIALDVVTNIKMYYPKAK